MKIWEIVSFISMIISVVSIIILGLIGSIIENHMGGGYIHTNMIWMYDLLYSLLTFFILSLFSWTITHW